MEPWQEAELEYARRLRQSTAEQRKSLYGEAYSAVSALAWTGSDCDDPEKRTAGTSRVLVEILARLCRPDDVVLEVGCGRGYTCLGLAGSIKQIVGTDVSDPSLQEARALLRRNKVSNARILKAGADALTEHFEPESFDKVISIDVYEHLHPDDALKHLREVYKLLKRGGAYIIKTPNRVSGPHDMTKDVFPDAKEALGFHLNELTNRELMDRMREIGFGRFRSMFPLAHKLPVSFDIWYPAQISSMVEGWYNDSKDKGFVKRLKALFMGITLMAVKCK